MPPTPIDTLLPDSFQSHGLFSRNPVSAARGLRVKKEVDMICVNGLCSKNVFRFLRAGLITLGLVASTTCPVLAGAATFNRTGSMNTANEPQRHTARRR